MANEYENIPELSSIYDREMRRRKINEMLLQQAIEPQQTQMVSGRAVPMGIEGGLIKIAQALLAKRGLNKSDEALKGIGQQYQQGQKTAVQDVMRTMQGSPQTGGPLRGTENYQPFTPEVKPDLEAAAMKAVTDPYLSQNQGAQSVLSAMLRAKGYGANSADPYFTPEDVVTKEGDQWVVKRRLLDRRAGKYVDLGTDYLSKDDPRIKGMTAGAQEQAKSDVQAVMKPEIESKTEQAVLNVKHQQKIKEEKPQRQMQIESAFAQQENIDKHIDSALNKSGYFTTGIIGSVSQLVPGTEAFNLAKTLDTIKASIGLEALQDLRNAGGTLGQVTEAEHRLLQDKWTSLSQSQSKEEFETKLRDLKDQVKASRERISSAYEKTYGVPYEPTKKESVTSSQSNIEELLKKYGNQK